MSTADSGSSPPCRRAGRRAPAAPRLCRPTDRRPGAMTIGQPHGNVRPRRCRIETGKNIDIRHDDNVGRPVRPDRTGRCDRHPVHGRERFSVGRNQGDIENGRSWLAVLQQRPDDADRGQDLEHPIHRRRRHFRHGNESTRTGWFPFSCNIDHKWHEWTVSVQFRSNDPGVSGLFQRSVLPFRQPRERCGD